MSGTYSVSRVVPSWVLCYVNRLWTRPRPPMFLDYGKDELKDWLDDCGINGTIVVEEGDDELYRMKVYGGGKLLFVYVEAGDV